MSKKEYTGKAKGGAGLGQGRKKEKKLVHKGFFLDAEVAEVIQYYSSKNGFPHGTIVKFLETAICEYHQQITNRKIEFVEYADYEKNKKQLLEAVEERSKSKT